jgi:hypothetical protein
MIYFSNFRKKRNLKPMIQAKFSLKAFYSILLSIAIITFATVLRLWQL